MPPANTYKNRPARLPFSSQSIADLVLTDILIRAFAASRSEFITSLYYVVNMFNIVYRTAASDHAVRRQ